MEPVAPPDTIERWCFELVTTCELEQKLSPPQPPDLRRAGIWAEGPALRLDAPGRPPELRAVARAPKTPTAGALTAARARAQLVHTFLHHELQAAELFAWALLAFPETPREFRAGLVRLCQEELGHLALYRRHLAGLGFGVGAFPVRDWFWERVSGVGDPLTFVAWLGLGLEGANLEHSARFEAQFRAAGDDEGARILAHVGSDEIAHVDFARTWFERFSGGPLEYERWRALLPRPLTPGLLRGKPLNRVARKQAGLDERFLAHLDAAPAANTRSPR